MSALLIALFERRYASAEAIGTGDADVEAFGAWFRRERGRLDELITIKDRTAIETARARAELAVARTALEVAENMATDMEHAARTEALRREQIVSDEAAGRLVPDRSAE